jgi:phenylpropionate dioxygenase-like ring-hydroxylating dioxygenase large terminal subunit
MLAGSKTRRTVPAVRGPQERAQALGQGRLDWSTWPRYEAAALGFREYWYPLAWSRQVGRRPIRATLLGEELVLERDAAGAVTATSVAAATADRHARTYPVAERIGLLWIYVGEADPPPVDTDIPAELLRDDAVIAGRRTVRHGNWRFGAENGVDEGHAKYLHRNSLWTLKRQMPTWVRHHMEATEGGWITRKADEVHFDSEFPNLGRWPPKKRFWRQIGRGAARVSIKLPCTLRVQYQTWTHFEWWVPVTEDRHVYLQLATQPGRGVRAQRFKAYYWSWVRWVFHGMFNEEDALMVDVMDAPPERLYRPDVAITEWRKLCERDTRGTVQPLPELVPPGSAPVEESPLPDITRLVRRSRIPLSHRIRMLIEG